MKEFTELQIDNNDGGRDMIKKAMKTMTLGAAIITIMYSPILYVLV